TLRITQQPAVPPAGLRPEHVIVQMHRHSHISRQGDVESIANYRSGVIFALVHRDRADGEPKHSIWIASRRTHRIGDMLRNLREIRLWPACVENAATGFGAAGEDLE